MKMMLPDLLGTVGVCVLVAGLYRVFGDGVALLGAGLLLMAGAFLAAHALKRGQS